MSALARKIDAEGLGLLAGENTEPTQPSLRVVTSQETACRGLIFRWQMDPVTRQLVQVWEPRD